MPLLKLLVMHLHLMLREVLQEALVIAVGRSSLEAVESPELQPQAAPVAAEPAAKKHSDPWRKLLWWGLGAAFVLQAYYVREMLAALVIFTFLFVIGAVIAGVVYLLGRAGETTVTLAEPVARRGVAYAEEISKKAFRRPHSAPAP